MKSVYCAVQNGSLNKAVCASSLNVLKRKLQEERQEVLMRGTTFIIMVKKEKHGFTRCARWSFWWK